MTNTPAISSELVERAKRGDRVALEEVLRAVHPLVHNVCRRTLNVEADAEDAAQNALINIVRHLERFDGRSSFTTWAYRIATNAALDEGRRRGRRHVRIVHGHDDDVVDTASPSAHGRVDDADELGPLLRQLPDDFRVAVILRDVMDLDYDEIAEILGVPGGTVRSRIARGRARLAELLGNQTSTEQRHTRGRDA